MANFKLVLDKEEQQEKKELLDFVDTLKREDQLKLQGFLEAVAFLAVKQARN